MNREEGKLKTYKKNYSIYTKPYIYLKLKNRYYSTKYLLPEFS